MHIQLLPSIILFAAVLPYIVQIYFMQKLLISKIKQFTKTKRDWMRRKVLYMHLHSTKHIHVISTVREAILPLLSTRCNHSSSGSSQSGLLAFRDSGWWVRVNMRNNHFAKFFCVSARQKQRKTSNVRIVRELRAHPTACLTYTEWKRE